MPDQTAALHEFAERLERWEEKFRTLRAAPMRGTRPGRRMYDQCMQEVADRLECARVKLEKLRRLGDHRFDEVSRELDRAFSELQAAWDMTVAKVAWSDPYADADPP